MSRNLPSHRYDLFIKLLEKEAHEVQQRFRRIESLEQVYNIVRDVLEAHDLPNNTSLKASSYSEYHKGVYVSMHATRNDRMTIFDALAEDIGKGLKSAGLHDGKSAVSDLDMLVPQREYIWRMRKTDETTVTSITTVTNIDLTIYVPDRGTADVEVITNEVVTKSRRYTLKPRGEPLGEITAADCQGEA